MPFFVTARNSIRPPHPSRAFGLVFLLWLTLFLPATATAQGPAQVYLEALPMAEEDFVGTWFVNIIVADVSDLYGVSITLNYDPSQLAVRDSTTDVPEVIQIVPGPLLGSSRFVATNQADPTRGEIRFSAAILSPSEPVSGQGVLATIPLNIIGPGPYNINIVKVTLASRDSVELPVTTTNFTLEPSQILPATPALPPTSVPSQPLPPSPVSVWLWGLLLSLLALVILFVLALPRLKQAAAPPIEGQTFRRIPSGPRSSSQSSASLVRQGQQAQQRGDVQAAYTYFSEAIQLDPSNPAAWLGKGQTSQQETERRICFQRVLALDPTNQIARQELAG